MKKIILSFVVIAGVFCFSNFSIYGQAYVPPPDPTSTDYQAGYTEGHDDGYNGRPKKQFPRDFGWAMSASDSSSRNNKAGYMAGYAQGVTDHAIRLIVNPYASGTTDATDYQKGFVIGYTDFFNGSPNALAYNPPMITDVNLPTLPPDLGCSAAYVKGYNDGYNQVNNPKKLS